jgi:hypothetical protein
MDHSKSEKQCQLYKHHETGFRVVKEQSLPAVTHSKETGRLLTSDIVAQG